LASRKWSKKSSAKPPAGSGYGTSGQAGAWLVNAVAAGQWQLQSVTQREFTDGRHQGLVHAGRPASESAGLIAGKPAPTGTAQAMKAMGTWHKRCPGSESF
jgi:hypothetical protein